MLPVIKAHADEVPHSNIPQAIRIAIDRNQRDFGGVMSRISEKRESNGNGLPAICMVK